MRLKKLPSPNATALEKRAAEIAAADAERPRLIAELRHEMWLKGVKAPSYGEPLGWLADYDDGGGAVMAALEADEPGWRWREDRIVGYDDEDEPVYDWEHWRLSSPWWTSPERRAAQEQELLAFERALYGPFHYVERNHDPSKQTVGSEWLSPQAKTEAKKGVKARSTEPATGKPRKPRKSRRKPVFWTPKKA